MSGTRKIRNADIVVEPNSKIAYPTMAVQNIDPLLTTEYNVDFNKEINGRILDKPSSDGSIFEKISLTNRLKEKYGLDLTSLNSNGKNENKNQIEPMLKHYNYSKS